MSAIRVVPADFKLPQHAAALRSLMDHYARDPMGGGQALDTSVLEALPEALASHPGAFSVLAFSDRGEAVGLINCFEGFSTFRCEPLLNIHDVIVLSPWRGQGISQQLLEAVETEARRRGCCKLTLEVLSGNQPAIAAYQQYGFSAYQLDAAFGSACFWEKPLN